MGWLISILLHLALAGTFLVLSIYRDTPELQNQPNLQTPVQAALTDLEMSPVVSDLQVEPMLTDDFTPENPLMPQQPQALPANSTAPEQAANLAVFSKGNSGFTVPAHTVSGGNPYQSQFCGTAGSGQCICYVVDCSGSMVMALDYVRAELRRAISQLTPAQYFHVIFYAGAEPIELPPGRLIRASAPNRQRAIEFVNQVKLKTVSDKTSAAPAVVKALNRALTTSATNHLQANLVYLLTDGQYDHSYVADAVKRIQTQRIRPARINVISCGMQQNETFLRRLAMSYQGSYHYVSDEQMAEKK
jgi:VWA domain-containing protein